MQLLWALLPDPTKGSVPGPCWDYHSPDSRCLLLWGNDSWSLRGLTQLPHYHKLKKIMTRNFNMVALAYTTFDKL